MSELATWSVTDLATAVQSRRVSAVDVTRAALERIERLNPALNAYLYIDREGALAAAAQVDKRVAASEVLPLAGVPIGVKDNLCTRGVRTTCASRILEGYIPPYDAHVVQRLRDAGAVAVGKLNLDEFAMGSSNENSAFGPVKNPWDTARTPGGSSGGSAAAAALALGAATLGSDTGGSVRQPASYCGVTAIKPTYGRVSRYGLIAFASSLDQVGPIARSTQDAARVLQVIAGRDARDATSADVPVPDYVAECGKDLKGLRVGVVRNEGLTAACDASVKAAFESAVTRLTELGCEVVEVELPHQHYALSVYYIAANAEASSNLARFDGMRYGLRVTGDNLQSTYQRSRAAGFGAEVKRRIMLGTYVLSAGYYDALYLKAQKVRTLISQDYAAAFQRCDVLLTPTAPTPAFVLGAVKDPMAMYSQDIFTLPASLAGVPAISVPCGLSPEGLPLGLQAVAPAFEEARLVRFGHAFEAVSGLSARPADF